MHFNFFCRKSSSDILSSIQVNEIEDGFQMIRVRRKHIWEDSLRAFKKQSFSCKKPLKVHFIGEEAEDAGGPKREYLRLLMRALEEKSGILEGLDNHKVFTSNPLLVYNNVYFIGGLMVSVSLTQGGPGLCCLAPTLYAYISNQPVWEPTIIDVPDYNARTYIEKVYIIYYIDIKKVIVLPFFTNGVCKATTAHTILNELDMIMILSSSQDIAN